MATVRKYTVSVSARKFGTHDVFENYEIQVDATDDSSARISARENLLSRGFETRGCSILKEENK